jgi:hypothetical protein
MTRARWVSLLAAVLVITALGCGGKDGRCNPGDTRASGGHTQVCNSGGRWVPYVKPTVRS